MVMKKLILLVLSMALAGCTGARKYSKYDEFEDVRVDQMTGNVISGRIFGKTSLGLSARRESHLVTALTNTSVISVTNSEVTYQTNVTSTSLTNLLLSAATNAVVAPPTDSTNAPGIGEAVPAIVLANLASPGSTNVMLTSSGSHGVTRANNQTTVTAQLTTQYNNQVSATSNNVTITTQFSRNITAETNLVITVSTNQFIIPMTNVAILATNLVVRDYFLLVELLPPPDFTLQSGDSLVLLVDGQRQAFLPANPQSVYVARKGYLSTFYRTTAQTLLAIANAKEVRIRLKGVNNVIERTMPRSAQNNFRKFLLKNFNNQAVASPGGKPATVAMTASEVAILE